MEIRLLDGIKAITDCLTSTDMETKRSAVGALINLSVNGSQRSTIIKLTILKLAKNKVEIRNEGGLSLLVQCLLSTDTETRRYSLRAIYNLAINGKTT